MYCAACVPDLRARSERSIASSQPSESTGRMKISVAMTTYNGALYLREQLDSILGQSRLPDELIVCDDRSTDATPSILEEYAARSPFAFDVRINETRLGSTKNFERAIGLCTGDIICLSDQDDVWMPQKLAVIEQRFDDEPEVGLVFTNGDLIDDTSSRLGGDLWSRSRFTKGRQKALKGPSRYNLLFGLPIATGATMAFRSRFSTLILPIPADAPSIIHDRWIAIMITAVGRIEALPEKLIAYRLHRQQQLGVGKIPLPLRLFIPHPCRSDAAGLAAVQERVDSSPAFPASPEFGRALIDRQRHVKVRAKFSRNPVRRAVQVAKEIRTGGYGLYPYGLIIALQDLIAGTR